jgi:transaldolase / glucose-6-phosphate isomerase
MKVPDQYGFVQYSAGIYADAITAELDVWQKENKIKRLWAGDAALWTNSDEGQWIGWLNVAAENSDLPRIAELAKDIKTAGTTDIVLLGMGGSSLCPAMMAKTFDKIADFPRLQILDSTDPMQIRHLEESIDLGKTFFIVSSKSGNTLEPNILKDYFYARLQVVLNKTDVNDRFIAITDPGTMLDTIAKKENFKAIFYGVPSIGGRYSALSNFGIVPSGLMGLDIKNFLSHVENMHKVCSPEVPIKNNPGAALGVILGVCAKQGKDKITFIISPEIYALGSWLEQLLAESTGKNGKGLIPVDQEPLGGPAVYGDDRLFVYIRLKSAPDPEQDRAVLAFEQAGFVVVRLTLADKIHLGAELFRWEIATDVASSILGVDPFNQPDVEESKVLTLQLTEQYEITGQLPKSKPFFSANGIKLFSDEENEKDILNNLKGEPSIANYLQAYLQQVKKNDYVDISAFIEMSDEHNALLQESRVLIRDTKKVATCLGFGPRFLHSTGQVYKGGPNIGVFLQITADFNEDLQVPTHAYTFGLVISAQAQADFTVLAKRSRRVLRIHLGKDVQGGLLSLRMFMHDVLREKF